MSTGTHTHVRTQLLLATLQRAGRPMNTAQLRDEATGLALAEGWDEALLASCLSRRNVAALMRNLIKDTHHVVEGPAAYDVEARKPTPTYMAAVADSDASIPLPPDDGDTPEAETTRAEQMNAEQMLAVIRVSDEVFSAVARFMRDLQDIQSRARRDLQAMGLEVPR